ncbi:ornithine carbamoyltransferase [Buchnera aphidicola]|uniref:Ornithine carbamoyltransferase n=1 Tax=Buchnera aphidicola (Cinara strobi) TaxID=1921549 RepID=A0A3B1DLN2_9GAMM|nr:ornithine carbamoyltransferase [Buchnera aphidicola]VAX76611.1 Ornithine carbamoyltransferase subunit I [Buchnera aphidicola (Cinara strobi)]
MQTLYQKNCLRLFNFNHKEIQYLIKLSKFFKQMKNCKSEKKYLKGKNIVLIFEKPSTRTRCSFEIAAHDQGAKTTYLGPNDTHLGYKESVHDSAAVLGKIYNGILYRGFCQKILENLQKYSNIPVWNGLTDIFHPTQILSDLFTMSEIHPNTPLNKIKCAYVGDAQNNIANSLLEAAFILNLKLNIVAPKSCWPKKNIIFTRTEKLNTKKNILYTDDIKKGIKNVDFIYTDVWISMGEKKIEWKKKIKELFPYQVNKTMLEMTNNPNVKVLHCLPALHDKKSTIGLKIHNQFNLKNGLEITDDIFYSNKSIILQQSENKMHTLKALLVSCLSKKKFF